jgi:hypothetical protein
MAPEVVVEGAGAKKIKQDFWDFVLRRFALLGAYSSNRRIVA